MLGGWGKVEADSSRVLYLSMLGVNLGCAVSDLWLLVWLSLTSWAELPVLQGDPQ